MKKVLFGISLLFITSCTTTVEERKLYPADAVWAMFNACYQSIQAKHTQTYGTPADPNFVGAYCTCSIDKLREKYDYDTVKNDFSQRKTEKMTEVSRECNQEMGFGQPKKVL